MCFTFEKNNKQSKKPSNCFLQDGAIAIGIVIKCRFYTEDEFNRRWAYRTFHIWTLTRLKYKTEMSLTDELINRYGQVQKDMDKLK